MGIARALSRTSFESISRGAFETSTGLILAKSGEFSRQADLLITDGLSNAPLYGEQSAQVWPVEAVYALFEIKTHLQPTDLQDAIGKCRRFKTLPRQFADTADKRNIDDSLFVLWGFESPRPETLKENLVELLADVPAEERPDFVVVPGSSLTISGDYYSLIRTGAPGSRQRAKGLSPERRVGDAVYGEGLQCLALGDHSLFAFLYWFDSWLALAGPRRAALDSYVPQDFVWGRRV